MARKGRVQIKVNGKSTLFKFGMGTIARFEEKTNGRPFHELFKKAPFSTIVEMLFLGATYPGHENKWIEELGKNGFSEFIDELPDTDSEKLMKAMNEGISRSMTAITGKKEEELLELAQKGNLEGE